MCREEVKVKTLSAQKRKILKNLLIKLERTYKLAHYPDTRCIGQDELRDSPSIAFGIEPLEYREGKNFVKANGYVFGICSEYLPMRLNSRYLKEFLEFRDSLEPRTIYKFRKFSDKEIAEMMKKENRDYA